MSMTPMQHIEQPVGFTFDSMDFVMSRSSACMIQVSANNPTTEDWEEEDDEDEEDTETQLGEEEVAVEVDEDLDDEDDQSSEDEEDEVYSDDDDDFEKYLRGDGDD